jgi:galactokinase
MAEDYSCAFRLLRLPGHVPMPAFRDVIDVPLVVRKARRSRDQVRQDLGIPLQSFVVIFIYGGQPPGGDWRLEEDCLPEGWICIVCSAGKPPGNKPLPSRNFILADEDAYTPDLIAASDVCLGKIGYGTTSECLAHSIPLVFTRRDFFNEEPFLRKLLEVHGAAVEIRRRDFLAGNWAPYLERALSLGPIRYDQPTDGAQVVARLLGEAVEEWRRSGGRRGSGTTTTATTATDTATFISPPLSPRREGEFHHLDGRGRLRDAIVWGYMMQRHEAAPSKHGISDVLEWYTQGTDPYESSSLSLEEEEEGGGRKGEPSSIINGGRGREGGRREEEEEEEELKAVTRLEREREKGIVDGYDVIEGPDLGMFPDTVRFLGLLKTLHQQQQREQGEGEGGGGGGGGGEKVAGGAFKPPSVITTTTTTTRSSGNIYSKEKRQQASDLPERRAAVSLFRWDTESSTSDDDIIITRAPGRLDVMGGIADYSGSLVLQGTAAQGCHVALQLHPPNKQPRWKHMMGGARQKKMLPGGGEVVVEEEDRPALRIVSFNADATDRGPAFDMDLDEFFIDPGSGGTDSGGNKDKKGSNTTTRTTTPKASLEPISYEAAQDYFKKDPSVGWAAYVAGALLVLAKERGVRYTKGISILVSSEVPEGKGVSSSAAVEVATMMAVAAAHNITLAGHEVALLCQMVENLVVGAPCGVMDQMASALGEADCLLALRCQPAEVVGKVHIPSHMRIWGVDSGIRHSVGGSDYGAVRIGAFMGLKILSTKSERRRMSKTSGGGGEGGKKEEEKKEEGGRTATATAIVVKEEEFKEEEQKQLNPLGNGYLANISPSQYTSIYERMLPERITVEEFVSTYGRHWDAATIGRIDPGQKYAVKKPTAHPIFENFRVGAFKQILTASSGSSSSSSSNDDDGDTDDDASLPAWKDEQMNVLGELMLQSHASYSQCGLGSQGTDRLVQLVCEHQETHNTSGKVLYGGKITGGGSGGTVCILGRAGERGERAVREVMERYAEETGHVPFLFNGSSPGAVAFGCLRLRKRRGGVG